MSWSNPTEILTNPSNQFISWNGSKDGGYFYYDEKLPEKKDGKDVYVKTKISLPVTFLALDILHTIKGFSDSEQKPYWSNEVRNISTEKLNVRCGKQSVEIGLYKDIKDRLAKLGADYTQSVYIAIKDAKGELMIANINMKGAALSSWIEFRNKVKDGIHKNAIVVKSTKEGKKGAVTYLMPEFQLVPISEETGNKATELDKELQSYLTKYLAKNQIEESKDAEKEIAAMVENAHQNTYGTSVSEGMSDLEKASFGIKEDENPIGLIDDGQLPF